MKRNHFKIKLLSCLRSLEQREKVSGLKKPKTFSLSFPLYFGKQLSGYQYEKNRYLKILFSCKKITKRIKNNIFIDVKQLRPFT